MNLIIETNRINEGIESHSFGINDANGREIGASIEFSVVELESAPDSYRGIGIGNIQPGTYFTFRPQATRNGNRYGAGQLRVWCKTEAERIEKVASYLKRSMARASKKAA